MNASGSKTPLRPGPMKNQVDKKMTRKLSARKNKQRSVWFGLGMFGLVGWSVAIPPIAGIALGVWLDGLFPGRVSWTITLLFIGLVLGCINAWRWVRKESKDE